MAIAFSGGTCSGGAYTFQIPHGALAAQDNVAIPMKVHVAASVRCVFAYVQRVLSATLRIQRRHRNRAATAHISGINFAPSRLKLRWPPDPIASNSI